MAFYPKARRRLIYPESLKPSEGGAPLLATPDHKPRLFIYHSAVGSGSLYPYFDQDDQPLESHTWIGLQGQVEQYLDNTRRADANYKANAFAMSWETADNGHPDSFEWTPNQTVAIAESMVWGNQLYGIPIALPKTWDGTGMGYHTLFGAPSNWTPVAKSCPGTVRKKQFPAILEAARKLAELKSTPEGDMLANTPIPLEPYAVSYLKNRGTDVGSDNALPYSYFLVLGAINGLRLAEAQEATNVKLNELNQRLAKLVDLNTSGTP